MIGNKVLQTFDTTAAGDGINTAIDKEYNFTLYNMKLPFKVKPFGESMTLKISVSGRESLVLLSGIEIEKVEDIKPFWKDWWKAEDYFGVID